MCDHSFLSVLSAPGSCWRKSTGQDGHLCEVQPSGDTQEGQLLSSVACLGVWKTKFVPEKQGWACTPCCKVAGTSLLAYTEHRNLELLNNYLIIFSWAKAKASLRRQVLQYRGYCCFVKLFNEGYRKTVLSIFEIWRLWSAVLRRWAEVKDRERMHGSF